MADRITKIMTELLGKTDEILNAESEKEAGKEYDEMQKAGEKIGKSAVKGGVDGITKGVEEGIKNAKIPSPQKALLEKFENAGGTDKDLKKALNNYQKELKDYVEKVFSNLSSQDTNIHLGRISFTSDVQNQGIESLVNSAKFTSDKSVDSLKKEFLKLQKQRQKIVNELGTENESYSNKYSSKNSITSYSIEEAQKLMNSLALQKRLIEKLKENEQEIIKLGYSKEVTTPKYLSSSGDLKSLRTKTIDNSISNREASIKSQITDSNLFNNTKTELYISMMKQATKSQQELQGIVKKTRKALSDEDDSVIKVIRSLKDYDSLSSKSAKLIEKNNASKSLETLGTKSPLSSSQLKVIDNLNSSIVLNKRSVRDNKQNSMTDLLNINSNLELAAKNGITKDSMIDFLRYTTISPSTEKKMQGRIVKEVLSFFDNTMDLDSLKNYVSVGKEVDSSIVKKNSISTGSVPIKTVQHSTKETKSDSIPNDTKSIESQTKAVKELTNAEKKRKEINTSLKNTNRYSSVDVDFMSKISDIYAQNNTKALTKQQLTSIGKKMSEEGYNSNWFNVILRKLDASKNQGKFNNDTEAYTQGKEIISSVEKLLSPYLPEEDVTNKINQIDELVDSQVTKELDKKENTTSTKSNSKKSKDNKDSAKETAEKSTPVSESPIVETVTNANIDALKQEDAVIKEIIKDDKKDNEQKEKSIETAKASAEVTKEINKEKKKSKKKTKEDSATPDDKDKTEVKEQANPQENTSSDSSKEKEIDNIKKETEAEEKLTKTKKGKSKASKEATENSKVEKKASTENIDTNKEEKQSIEDCIKVEAKELEIKDKIVDAETKNTTSDEISTSDITSDTVKEAKAENDVIKENISVSKEEEEQTKKKTNSKKKHKKAVDDDTESTKKNTEAQKESKETNTTVSSDTQKENEQDNKTTESVKEEADAVDELNKKITQTGTNAQNAAKNVKKSAEKAKGLPLNYINSFNSMAEAEKKMYDYASSQPDVLEGSIQLLPNVYKNYEKLSYVVKEADDRYKTFTLSANKNTNMITKSGEKIKTTSSAWNTFSTSLKNHATSLVTYLMTFVSFYTAIDVVKQGISVVKNFDDAMTTISLTMDVTKSQLKSLTNESIVMAKQMGVTADQVTNVAQIYANMNTSMQEIVKTAKPTVMLASASGIDSSTVADDIQGVMNEFQLGSDQAMHIADVYESISANVAMDFGKGINIIAEGVQTAGALASDAGMSFEQFAGIVAKTAEISRQSGSTIGNAWKSIISRLSKSGSMEEEVDADTLSKASAALHAVGIEVYDSKGNFNDLNDTLTQLSQKWSSLTDAQQADIAYEVAGIRNRNQFTIAMKAYADATQLAAKTTQDTGITEENAQKRADSFSGKINILTDSLQQLAINFLNTDAVENFISILDSLINELNTLVKTFGVISTSTGLISIPTLLIKSFKGKGIISKEVVSSLLGNFGKIVAQELPNQIDTAQQAFDMFVGNNKSIEEVTEAFPELDSAILHNLKNVDKANVTWTQFQNVLKKSTVSSALVKGLGMALNVGIGAAVSLSIALIAKLATANSEANKIAREAAENYKTESNSIDDYKTKINSLESSLHSGTLTEEQTKDVKSQLLDIQKELISTYGTEAKGIDLLSDSYSSYNDVLDGVLQKQLYTNVQASKTPTFFQKVVGYFKKAAVSMSPLQSYLYKDESEKASQTDTAYSSMMEKEEQRSPIMIKASNDIYKKNMQAIQYMYAQAEKSISGVTYDRQNNTLIVLGKTAQDTSDKIQQVESLLQNLASNKMNSNDASDFMASINKNSDKAVASLSSDIKANKDSYAQYIESLLVLNNEYYDKYKKIQSDKSAYDKAQLSDDAELQAQAKETLVNDLQDILASTANNKDYVSLQSYLQTLYPELSQEISNWKFELNFTANTNDIKQQVQNIAKGIDTQGLTSEDIINYANGNAEGVKYTNEQIANLDKIINLAKQYNTLTEDLVAYLVKIGILQTDNQKKLQESSNKSQQNTEKKYGTEFGSVDSWFKSTGIDTQEEINAWNNIVNATNNAVEAKKKYIDTKISQEDVSVTTSETLTNVQKTTAAIESLSKVYSDVKDEGSFDFSSILGNENFTTNFGSLSSYEDFISVISSSPTDIKACQSAFNKLCAEYLKTSGILDNVTDKTAESTKQMLLNAGVTNADELVTAALANNKEVLANKTKALNAAINDTTNNVATETEAFVQSSDMTESARIALLKYVTEQTIFQNSSLNTSQKREELYKLIKAYAGAAAAANFYNNTALNASDTSSNWASTAPSMGTNLSGSSSLTSNAFGNIKSKNNNSPLNPNYGKTQDEITNSQLQDEFNKMIADIQKSTPDDSFGSNLNLGETLANSSGGDDKWKEEFEKKYKNLQHLKAMELITDEEYYKDLDVLNNKYFANNSKYIDEYQQYQEEVYTGLQQAYKDMLDKQISLLKSQVENGKITVKEYSDSVRSLLDNALANGQMKLSDYWSSLGDFYTEQVSLYDKAEKAVEHTLDKQVKSLDKQKDAIEKNYNSRIDALEKQKDEAQKIYDAQTKALEDQKKALQDANEERENQINLEKDEYNLQRSLQQRTKGTITSKGMIYDTDVQDIRDKQDTLAKDKLDQQVKKIDDQLDKLKDNFDKTSDDIDKQIDALKEEMQNATDAIQLQIDALNEYKDQWADVANQFGDAQDAMIASQVLGQNYETDILAMRTDVLKTFTNNYIALMQAQADAAVNAANAEVEAQRAAAAVQNAASKNVGSTPSVSSNTSKASAKSVSTSTKSSSTKKKKDNKWNGDEATRYTYGVGSKRIPYDQEGWTQDRGDETILSPSRDAVLTPLRTGDSVLTADMTKNLWEWAKLNPAKLVSSNMSVPASMANATNALHSIVQNISVTLPNITNETGFNNFKKELERMQLTAYQYSSRS